MEIKYKVFEKLREMNITTTTFQKDLSFGNSVITRLRHNTPVKTDTIGKICEYLQCPIQDIVEIKYNKIDRNAIQVAQTEKQIAELQEKLQRLKSE